MTIDILDIIEAKNISGEPCLNEAIDFLNNKWQEGNRNKELILRLMFLIWYCRLQDRYLTPLFGVRSNTAVFEFVH